MSKTTPQATQRTDEEAIQNLVDRFNAVMHTCVTANSCIIQPSDITLQIIVQPYKEYAIIPSNILSKLLIEFEHCYVTNEGLVLSD